MDAQGDGQATGTEGQDDATPGSLAWRSRQVAGLLRFAAGSRAEHGFAWLDDRGRPLPGQPVLCWITCRMTHVFALAHVLGDGRGGGTADAPAALDQVEHGVRALLGPLRDADDGGWHPAVTAHGAPDGPDVRAAYDHAFVLLAASSALTVGAAGAAELFERAVDVVDRRFWDEDAGMVVETWDAGWSRLDPYRGANSTMHMTEALLAAHAATGDRTFAERAQRITARMVESASATDWRLPEHYDAQWQPLMNYNHDRPADPFRPFGSTVGHGLEWARLALHLRAAGAVVTEVDGGRLLDAARHLFDRALGDGWSVDGAPGLVYTVDWDGRPVVRDRMHWVVAEALAAASTLGAVTGEQQYADWQRELWAYADAHLVDPVGGSWWHQLDPDGAPSDTVWQGKPDVYHALQALLVVDAPVLPGVLSSVAAAR